MADIDRRIAAVPIFPGLRRFPQGRGFSQWTGDDSKALMKVYLPAISGHVPPQMVRTFTAFMDFCYLARRSIINETTLTEMDAALARFHHERLIFEEAGVRLNGFSLPRQHSLKHYPLLIRMYGAPNGLCSSITESKHIKAVKEPWRRSNRFEPLGQMLTVNQRLDKLAAATVNFSARGMLNGPCVAPHVKLMPPPNPLPAPAPAVVDLLEVNGEDAAEGPRTATTVTLGRSSARNYPPFVEALSKQIDEPNLPLHIQHFLLNQLYPGPRTETAQIGLHPILRLRISVFHSAIATYYSPSDYSGVGGMHRQLIRSVPSWRNGPSRRDCLFTNNNSTQPGMQGMDIAQVALFCSFDFRGIKYPCALVRWFMPVDGERCADTGMWIVKPKKDANGRREMSLVHLDRVMRGAHLIAVYGDEFIPTQFLHTDSLEAFQAFYISKFSDHHVNEFAF
ncbi:hypothetical protein BD779DRAFT_1804434 [Infundibulicybe gibba]|nr:hypothetical protein BD779DRAFT_1804434 [Infundibulicybe gibba]